MRKKNRKNDKETQPGITGGVKPVKKKALGSLKRGLEWLLWLALISITLGLITYFGVQWRREIGDLKDENTLLKSRIDGLESNINELNQGKPNIDLEDYVTITEWGIRVKDLSGPGTKYIYKEDLNGGIKTETVHLSNTKSQSLFENDLIDETCRDEDPRTGLNYGYRVSISRLSTKSIENEDVFYDEKLGEKDGYSYYLQTPQDTCVKEAFTSVESEAVNELVSTAKSLEL